MLLFDSVFIGSAIIPGENGYRKINGQSSTTDSWTDSVLVSEIIGNFYLLLILCHLWNILKNQAKIGYNRQSLVKMWELISWYYVKIA